MSIQQNSKIKSVDTITVMVQSITVRIARPNKTVGWLIREAGSMSATNAVRSITYRTL